ncbi:MAG: Flp pilus assembly complex ATPase component [Gammaproteobacteria bacterium]|nr:Flp pilus assembly complex ATPase component [Gammaproteobacteria bacterium]
MEQLVTFQQFLLQIGLLDEEKIANLAGSNVSPEEIAKLGYLSRQDVDFYFKQFQDLQQVNLDKVNIADIIPIPAQFAKENKLIAINLPEEKSTLAAVTNPVNIQAIDEVTQYCQFPVTVRLAHHKQIEQFISAYLIKTRDKQQAMIYSLSSLDIDVEHKDEADKGIFRESSVVSKIIDSIINQAVHEKSTDIHIEARKGILHVYFRISKEMRLAFDLNVSLTDILRQKLIMMGSGEITNLKGIQDLGFRFTSAGEELAIRFSYLPTLEGYSIVMRVIYQNISYDLSKIIEDPELFEKVNHFMETRQGMMLVTGPTSSGKSTLLYGILSQMTKESGIKIITIEDPVETKLEGVNQVQVDADTGISFSDFIRASLRQNPDIIMLSEIRDGETAIIATRAAMTGIMVLATLHTQSAVHTVTRLLDLGIDEFLIGAGIRLVISARLLAKLCPHCRKSYQPTEEELSRLRAMKESIDWKNCKVWEKSGCIECGQKGYSGYQSINEALSFDQAMREQLYNGNVQEFYNLANQSLAGCTLLDKAIKLLAEGKIDLLTLYQFSEN